MAKPSAISLLDGGGNEDEAAASLDDVLGQDIDLNMPDGQLAAFVRRQFADSGSCRQRKAAPRGLQEVVIGFRRAARLT